MEAARRGAQLFYLPPSIFHPRPHCSQHTECPQGEACARRRSTLDMAGGEAALLQVLLVVILGLVEAAGGRDLGDDRAAEAAFVLQRLLRCLGGGLLLRRLEEDRAAVLLADVGALAIQRRRVVVLPEDGEQRVVADDGRVVLDLDDFGVAGVPIADVLVGGILDACRP